MDGISIRALRQRTQMTQPQFAERFHLNLSALQSWEQGRSRTPEYVVYLIGRVLDLEEEQMAAHLPDPARPMEEILRSQLADLEDELMGLLLKCRVDYKKARMERKEAVSNE